VKKWKVGIVGVGVLNSQGEGYGKIFHTDERSEVAALCDVDQDVLQKTAELLELDDKSLFSDYGQFLDADIDIVFIGTPIPFHAEEAIKAMEAGKHVLSEVTAAHTIEECRAMAEAQKRTGMTYMMAENYCYFHYIRQWRQLVEQGKLGKIYYAEGEYIHAIREMVVNSTTGEVYWRASRPPLHYCSHCLGPLLTLMDDHVVRATASGKGVNIMPDVGPGAIDIQVALFETAKGATIKLLRSSVITREPHLVYYSLYGTRGCLETSRKDVGKKALYYFEDEMDRAEERDISTADPDGAKLGPHGGTEYFVIQDFLDSLDHKTPPPIDIARAMDFTVPGIVAHQAAMEGNVWLDVPRIN